MLGIPLYPDKTITCPHDLERIGHLQSKYREYLERKTNPKLDHIDQRINLYKISILGQVLCQGVVNYADAAKTVKAAGIPFLHLDFKECWAIIDDYVETGGRNTTGCLA